MASHGTHEPCSRRAIRLLLTTIHPIALSSCPPRSPVIPVEHYASLQLHEHCEHFTVVFNRRLEDLVIVDLAGALAPSGAPKQRACQGTRQSNVQPLERLHRQQAPCCLHLTSTRQHACLALFPRPRPLHPPSPRQLRHTPRALHALNWPRRCLLRGAIPPPTSPPPLAYHTLHVNVDIRPEPR